jgi:hypothetical protein
VVVSADDLALLDLRQDGFPAIPVHDHRRDTELLASLVIELEDHDVRLAAVDAGVLTEVLDELIAAFV